MHRSITDSDYQTRNLAPRRGRILWRLGFSLAVLVFLLTAAFIWWNEGAPEREVERMLAGDGPKVGAAREEVEAWLAQRGIWHERITSLEGAGGYPAEQPPSRFGDLVPDIQDKFVVGRINPSDLDCSGGGQIWIYFFFDADNRLVQHVIKRWYGYL